MSFFDFLSKPFLVVAAVLGALYLSFAQPAAPTSWQPLTVTPHAAVTTGKLSSSTLDGAPAITQEGYQAAPATTALPAGTTRSQPLAAGQSVMPQTTGAAPDGTDTTPCQDSCSAPSPCPVCKPTIINGKPRMLCPEMACIAPDE